MNRKLLANRIGGFIAMAALIGFAFAFSRAIGPSEARYLFIEHWTSLIVALAIYMVAFAPLTLAWIVLTKSCGVGGASKLHARIFLVSQIGKYLPGNFGQFIGRAYLASHYNLPLRPFGAAMLLEIACVLLSGGLLSAILSIWIFPSGIDQMLPIVGVASALIIITSTVIWMRRVGFAKRLELRHMILAIVLYAVLFLIVSASKFVMLGMISGNWGANLTFIVAASVVISWLLGFITPGAPAGIGIRELTAYSLLIGSYPKEELLFALAAFRIVTLLGDIIALLLGLLIARLAVLSGDDLPCWLN